MMIDLSKYFEPYERKARVYPALLVLLPCIIGISIKFPELYSSLTGVVALFVAFGGLHLLAQIGRDAGKKLESKLYEDWGGIPSVSIFRHQNTILPKPAKAVIHSKLAKATGTACPTVNEESESPSDIDEIYRTWSDYLRRNSRDTKRFDLLFKENTNFGFRRNVLGLKYAYCISGIIALIIMMLPYGSTSNEELGIMLAVALYTLYFTIFVNNSWVKMAGIEYAKRLVETHEEVLTNN